MNVVLTNTENANNKEKSTQRYSQHKLINAAMNVVLTLITLVNANNATTTTTTTSYIYGTLRIYMYLKFGPAIGMAPG